jgi:importin subunit alpha-6/7
MKTHTTGDDTQTQFVINLNALPALLWLLDNSKKNIRKEACWTLSNITAGTADQIQSVINAGVFPKLIELLRASEFDIQKEAAWAVSNATSGGAPEQILYLVHQGAVPPLCALLNVSDVKVVTVALEGLENILKAGQATSQEVFDRIGTFDIIHTTI